MGVIIGFARRTSVRLVALGKTWLIGLEARRASRLPAVGDNDGEVRQRDSSGGRDHGKPAAMIEEKHDGHHKADDPQPHHQQVPALPLIYLRGTGLGGLGYQICLVTTGTGMTSHPLTLGPKPAGR